MRKTLPPEWTVPRRKKREVSADEALAALTPDWRQWTVVRLKAWVATHPDSPPYFNYLPRERLIQGIEALLAGSSERA